MRAKEFSTSLNRPDRGHNPVNEGIVDMAALAAKAKQLLAQGLSEQKVIEQLVKEGTPVRFAQQAVQAAQINEARMSAQVKLQRAFEREQAKSTASRKRGEEVMAQAKKDAEKKSKEQNVSEYGDTAKGQKMLTKVQKRAVDRMIKADDKNDAKNAKKNQETANRAWDRMTDKDLEEARANTKAVRAGLSKREKRADPTMDAKKQSEQDAAWERLQAHMNKPENMDVLKRLATKEDIKLDEKGKASKALCISSRPDSDLGASNLASCKSQGLRARDGDKSHKLGKSAKSRVKVGGHKIKGHKYGGPLPDWS